jgi:hypothetical protein
MVSLTALSARGHTSVDVGRDATEVTLRFTDDADTAAGILELEVRDGATGKPIPKFGTMLTRALRTQYAASGIPGRAVFDSAAAGVYELCVTADGYAPEIVPGVSIETNGRAKQSVKLGRGATVKGTLRAPEGAVPEEFDVYLTRADRLAIRGEHQPYASVDESGKFRLVALAPGTYSVIVVKRRDPDSQMLYAAKWALPVQTIVTVGAAGTESECTLDLVPGGSLDVRVNSEVLKLDWNGAPATDEQLELAATSSFTIRDVKNVVLFSSTGLDDRDLRERAVPAGVLLLRLEVAGRPPQEREVTILPGKRTRVQFDVR